MPTPLDATTLQAWAAYLAVPIAAEFEPGVLEHLSRLQAMAHQVLDFPLTDIQEPLPTLHLQAPWARSVEPTFRPLTVTHNH